MLVLIKNGLESLIRFVFMTNVFLELAEEKWNILNAGVISDQLKKDNQSQMLLFSFAFIIRLFHDYGDNF